MDKEDILRQGNYPPIHMRTCKSDMLGTSLNIIQNPNMWSYGVSIHYLLELNKAHIFTKVIYNYLCQAPSNSRHINVPVSLDLLPLGTFTSRPFFTIGHA